MSTILTVVCTVVCRYSTTWGNKKYAMFFSGTSCTSVVYSILESTLDLVNVEI